VLSFRPAELTAVAAAPLPVLASDALLSTADVVVGDVVPVRQGSAESRSLRIDGAIRGVPTVAPDVPAAFADLPTLALADYARHGTVLGPDEWWIGVDPGTEASVAAALAAGPLAVSTVRIQAAEIADRSNDPLALGIIGALVLAAAAAALFAVVGFGVSAWITASERIRELALARALGVSAAEITRWLAYENAFLLITGLGGGLLLGLVVTWVVLPSVTLTPDGSAPVPPVRLADTVDLVGVLVLVGLAAMVVTVAGVRRVVLSGGIARPLREGVD
jgi:hypothetical protein